MPYVPVIIVAVFGFAINVFDHQILDIKYCVQSSFDDRLPWLKMQLNLLAPKKVILPKFATESTGS